MCRGKLYYPSTQFTAPRWFLEYAIRTAHWNEGLPIDLAPTISEFVVRLSRSGKRFTTLSNVSILESGLSAGITLPYGCANGSCGDCRARVVSGHVDKIQFHDYALTESEKLNGVCLLCSYAAKTDLVVEVSEASSVEDIPFQQTRGKLCHLEQVEGIWVARFKLTRGKALRYLPGQYATVTLPDNQQHKLPIANCPCESTYLEFHVPNNVSLDALKPLDRVDIDGPYGQFTLSDLKNTPTEPGKATLKPVVFLALNTGFAAIKPLVEHVLSLEQEVPCALVWVASDPATQYRNNLCRSWADAFDQFTYLATDCIASAESFIKTDWQVDLTDAEAYVSGSTEECSDCGAMLTNAGIMANSITLDTA